MEPATQRRTSAWWQPWLAVQRTRRFVIAHALAVLLSVALAFVPLFNLLGYEFALVVSAFVAAACAPLTLGRLPAGTEARGMASQDGPAGVYASLLGHNLALLLGPCLIMSVNGLRVPVCDYQGGLALYALLPGVTVVHATLAAYVAAVLAGRRRWLAYLLYYALVVVSVGGALAYLALEPPIVTVNAYFGYFAGSIYDEALAIPAPLLAYRLLQLAFVGALVAALEVAWRVRRGVAFALGLRPLALGLAATVIVGFAHHVELGFSITRTDIEAQLGGRYVSEHFVLIYPATQEWEEQIEEIADDHEFRFAQLSRFFGGAPFDGPIVSYLYGSREEKGRLMGARRTLVAKLWLGEMHLLLDGYGDPILSHEMAHVFSQPWGSGPLDLSAQWGIVPNMGLVEGLATAADFSGRELTPHGWAAALRRLDLAPDIATILGAGGFYARHSRTVYTVMGSFVRWLIDTRGVEKFAHAYATGAFEEAYSESLVDLVGGWERFLDSWALGPAELALAEYYFDQPSIFGKVCARNIASRKLALEGEVGRGRLGEAVALTREIVALDPSAPTHQHQLVTLLMQSRAFKEAQALTESLLAQDGLGVVRKAQLRETLGDLRWLRGDLQGAVLTYAEVLEEALPADAKRRIRIKEMAVGDEVLDTPVRRYFLEPTNDGRKLIELLDARTRYPHQPVLAYLVGLRMAGVRHFDGAATHLAAALEAGTLDDEIAENARFVLAESYFFQGAWEPARELFTGLTSSAAYEGQRARAKDWLARIAWREGRQQP